MQSIRICPSFPRLNILSLPGPCRPRGLSQTMFISPRQSAHKHSGGSDTVDMFPWMQRHTRASRECRRRNDNRWNVAMSRRQGSLKAGWWHHYRKSKAFPHFHCAGERIKMKSFMCIFLRISVGCQVRTASETCTAFNASECFSKLMRIAVRLCRHDSYKAFRLTVSDYGKAVSRDRHSREVSGVSCLHWWQTTQVSYVC